MAWTNQAILDTLLGASAMLMILASIGGTPSYNIILPLYLGLGLYTRIPRALLVGLVGLLVSVVADICWLSISGKAVLSSLHSNGPSLYLSTAGFGVVMTILNLLAKVRATPWLVAEFGPRPPSMPRNSPCAAPQRHTGPHGMVHVPVLH